MTTRVTEQSRTVPGFRLWCQSPSPLGNSQSSSCTVSAPWKHGAPAFEREKILPPPDSGPSPPE